MKLYFYDLGKETDRAQARAACRNRPGVYLLRRKGESRMAYVGSSDPGAIQRRYKADPLRLWKTINRHFQSCRSRGVYSFGSDNWCTSATARRDYELALMLTKNGDDARRAEEAAIEKYKPHHNAIPSERAAVAEADAGDDGIPF